MTDKIKGILVALAAVAALAIGGAAIAGAAGGDNSSSQPSSEATENEGGREDASEDSNEGPDTPIAGSELDQASASALEHTGGGQVTETEVGDEESYYEVEVTLDDGSQVDVQLDRAFNVVGEETD